MSDSSPDKDVEKGKGRQMSLGTWIVERMNWSWFTATQSTGGVAVLLSECPKQFAGLQTVGVVLFILNLFLWLTFSGLMITKWLIRPSSFKKSFLPTECYFLGSFWLTQATFIICMQRFGVPHTGPWLVVAIRVLFWIYAAVTFISTVLQFVTVFARNPSKAIEMNPAWFLMVYQAMLTGTTAASIATSQPAAQRLPIIVAGVSYQGYGFMASFLIMVWLLGFMIEKGWPAPSSAPGLFLSVGAIGFTITALIGNARYVPVGYGYFANPDAAVIVQVMALWVGIFMWIFGFWLFAIALVVCLGESVRKEDGRWKLPMKFNNTWWSESRQYLTSLKFGDANIIDLPGFIFPNVGFTLGTIYIGQELRSNAIAWVSTAMVILVFAFWLFDLFLMAKTIIKSLFVDEKEALS